MGGCSFCSFFKKIFFDFLSYEGFYCAGGHFDPPMVRRNPPTSSDGPADTLEEAVIVSPGSVDCVL